MSSQATATTYRWADNVFPTLEARANASVAPLSQTYTYVMPVTHLPGLLWYVPLFIYH